MFEFHIGKEENDHKKSTNFDGILLQSQLNSHTEKTRGWLRPTEERSNVLSSKYDYAFYAVYIAGTQTFARNGKEHLRNWRIL